MSSSDVPEAYGSTRESVSPTSPVVSVSCLVRVNHERSIETEPNLSLPTWPTSTQSNSTDTTASKVQAADAPPPLSGTIAPKADKLHCCSHATSERLPRHDRRSTRGVVEGPIVPVYLRRMVLMMMMMQGGYRRIRRATPREQQTQLPWQPWLGVGYPRHRHHSPCCS